MKEVNAVDRQIASKRSPLNLISSIVLNDVKVALNDFKWLEAVRDDFAIWPAFVKNFAATNRDADSRRLLENHLTSYGT